MGLLNIGTRALQANQTALQTAGNNIANVNTQGYSRQKVVLQTVQGQFTGGGYVGNGVGVQTIQRDFSAFLTRQATLATSTQSADNTRVDYLKQMESIFQGGASGLGASISDMLNSFSDVANAPTDMTARTVVLTRINETASRMRSASQSLDDLQSGVKQELGEKVSAINSLARNIGEINEEIARATGSGQPPNDLLDRRDQLIRELNQYVQTSSIPATDGTVGIFIGGSQALVLGTTVSTVSIASDDFGDPLKSKLAINRSGQSVLLDENILGGGEVSGLLRFQNTDLAEGRNLLGRLTLATSTSMNAQHQLGLDLDGNVGGDLFTPAAFTAQNVRIPAPPATLNKGTDSLSLKIVDVSKFVASDYEVSFTSGTTGTITRRSDGVIFTFPQNPAPASGALATVDGFDIAEPLTVPAIARTAGDRFLIKPFSTSASNISSQFSTPRALAVASPVAGTMGTSNSGSLLQVALRARTNPPGNTPLTLTFQVVGGATVYNRSDDTSTPQYDFAYVPGQPIEGSFPDTPLAAPATSAPLTFITNPLAHWSVTLQGAPKAGDTYTVHYVKDTVANDPFIQGKINSKLDGGNASAMMGLRDVAMFDGAALTDGYAGLISQIGIRTQSANYAAKVSDSIASNLERDRAGVSGVNLDEEAAKLLQFQQAYQASAKMIQIANSIFDTLLQGMGR
jgi:flagellar hook-associated protein 1 FlgK